MFRVFPWLLLPLLVAGPALAAEPEAPTSLLILDFKHDGDEVSAQNARLINDLVAAAAEGAGGFKVITGADIANVVELEANKEALGCDTSSTSCLAEVAGAMGAELVLFGNVGQLGEVYLVTLNLFDSNRAQSAGRENIKARDLGEMPDKIDAAVARLLGEEVAPEPSPNLLQVAAWSTVGLGAVVAVGGYGFAAAQNSVVANPAAAPADKEAALDNGRLGLVVSVIGAAVAAVGVGLLFVPGGE